MGDYRLRKWGLNAALVAAKRAAVVLAPINPVAATAIYLGGLTIYAAARAALESWKRSALDACDDLSPLILDLDGDGVEADAIAYFDHEGDGWTELSRWANEDDGVLVWDRNNDGVINDGSELFGNNTVLSDGSKADHGFAALADLDDNGDGVIDSNDAAWSELRVMRWTDENENGMKDDGEEYFQTLDELGIQSLRTAYTNSDYVDESGNEHRQVGSYTKTDGTTATMTDVWFVTSTSTTQYDRSHIPEHSDAITALPEVAGGGVVYSLRDAMALDAAGQLQAPFYGDARTETRTLGQMVSDFTATDESGAPVLDKVDGEDNARKSEYLRSMAALYGQSEWLLAGMEATASEWVYEYQYYAEYLSYAVFDGNTHRPNDFVGNCGCSDPGDGVNVFQTTDGGNDRLEGRGGDDIYHLNYGTGHDRIEEQWRDSHPEGDEDVIKVAPGIAPDSVRLSRTRDDLIISLVNAEGEATDSLRIVNHYLFPDVGVHRNILIVSYYGAHLSRITSGDA